MSATGPRLADRYRKLLLCYPRAYRRERGEEIVNTLLELAPAGRARPTSREAANLICHGMRCRLGRPASATVVVWAALTALVCGLFTAALATRAAWETAPALPDAAEAAETFEAVLSDFVLSGDIDRSPATFVVYGQPLGPQHVDELLFGDGGEYEFGATSASFRAPVGLSGEPSMDRQRAVSLIREQLRATGWEVLESPTRNGLECHDERCDPATLPRQTLLTARRDHTIIEINVYFDPRINDASVSAALYRSTPWAVHPAGAAGGLLGALAGWLLFGWASRRTEARHAALRATATTLYGLMMFWWCLPILISAPAALAYHLNERHFRWLPLWGWLGQPVASLPFLLGCAMALLGLAIAALPHRAARARAVATR